jgi:AraC family transcriptional regulator of adaptative response / DNA-3-methyladenine glycosylase II
LAETWEAVQLIADGYLDGRTEDDLARKVGYSARQLRRLFVAQVGATPDFVARSRRAHFARRLLDETDLTMTQIAAAAGFGSSRQMRRVVESIFRFSPEVLRARRSRADRLPIDGGLRLRLPYVPPFDFGAALDEVAGRCIPGVAAVDGACYRRTILDHDRVGVIEVKDHGDGHHLELIAHLPTWRLIIEEVSACRRLFDLDFAERGHETTAGQASERQAAPARRLGVWDGFETAVLVLLSGSRGHEFGRKSAGRLAARFGVALPAPGVSGLSHGFPSARRLAEADPGEIVDCGLSSRLARTLVALARAVSSEELSLWPGRDFERSVQTLCAVPGIGSATAHRIAAVVCGRS